MDFDVGQALSYEIKKELADRYFGFRSFVSDEKARYQEMLREVSISYEQEICFILVRIYILLLENRLIERFLQIVGLNDRLFYDPYLLISPTIRQKVFANLTTRGLTRLGRFRGLLISSYDSLTFLVNGYREAIAGLQGEYEVINQEISLFYQKNDLSMMMQFLRRLDAGSRSALDETGGLVNDAALERKMRIAPPLPVEALLALVPPLVPLPHVKKELKKLAETAYVLHEAKGTLPL